MRETIVPPARSRATAEAPLAAIAEAECAAEYLAGLSCPRCGSQEVVYQVVPGRYADAVCGTCVRCGRSEEV